MLLALLCIILIVLSFRVWKDLGYLFNRDVLKNFSTTNVPLLKSGFVFMTFTPEYVFMSFYRIFQTWKRSVRQKLMHLDYLTILKAEDCEIVFGSSTDHIGKGALYGLVHQFLGTGLVTSDGPKWHRRRLLLTPAFHFQKLASYFQIFNEESDRLVSKLEEMQGKNVDIRPISQSFVLNAICEAAMGVKLSTMENDGMKYSSNLRRVIDFLMAHWLEMLMQSKLMEFFTGCRRKLSEIVVPIHAFTQAIVDARRKEFSLCKENIAVDEDENHNVYMGSKKKKRLAMLDTLLRAQSEGSIDNAGITEEASTFTFAGYETSSTALTFTLMLLAVYPDAQQRLFDEIDSAIASTDELELSELLKMTYMDRVLKESLRLYPPIPYIERRASKDFLFYGETISKGTTIQIPIFSIHRDPEQFPDPEKFDPDRFLPDNSHNRHNYAYIPFSAGMRNCIGQKFANMMLKVALCKVVKNFEILPITKREDLQFVINAALHTNHSIMMRFERRKNLNQ